MKITVAEKAEDATRAATVEFDGTSPEQVEAMKEFFSLYFGTDQEEEDDDQNHQRENLVLLPRMREKDSSGKAGGLRRPGEMHWQKQR